MVNNIRNLFSAWRYRLYLRTALLMLLITIFSLSVVGYLLFWNVRNILEDQFSNNLITISNYVKDKVDLSLIQFVESLGRENRTYNNYIKVLYTLKKETDLRRIFIFNSDWESIFDTDSTVAYKQKYYDLYLDQSELHQFQDNSSITSDLYEDNFGNLFKRAYVKIIFKNISYFIGIEATNDSMIEWKKIRSYYITLSGLIVMFSFAASYFFSKSISVPMRKLVDLTKENQKGNLKKKININMKDEVGILAQNMEKMRKSILRKDQQQKVVLAGIAHEVRNPLGGIEMFAGIIASETENIKIKQQTQKILKESKQIQKILKEFNEFGKPKSPEYEGCDLIQFIHETRELLSMDLEAKNISVNLISKDSIFIVSFDPGHLRQILLNLVKNSIQFSPKGGRINIEVVNGEKTYIDLKDEGPGIPYEKAELIYEPFYSSEEGHAGLGLAIVKNLMEENGSYIQLLKSYSGDRFRLEFHKGSVENL